MEPLDNFYSKYSKSIDGAVTFFKKNPPVGFLACKLLFQKAYPQATDQEVIKFYEAVLTKGPFFQERLSHTYCLGRYIETKALADQCNAKDISQLCTIQFSDFDRIDSLERPPEPDCDIGELSNWVKYHFFRRTLNKASIDFKHQKKDAYALIYLYQGNYIKALEYISGDLFVEYEHYLLKAFCYFSLEQNIKGSRFYNQALEKGALITNTFEPFLILCRFSNALAAHEIDRIHTGLKIPSLELFYFSSDESPIIKSYKPYLNILSKEHSNPYLRFFNLIISAKKIKSVSASIFLALTKNEPIKKIDYLITLYLAKTNVREALLYCQERDKIHPHPLLLENRLIVIYNLIFLEPDNLALIEELKETTETYLSRGYDRSNILFALAWIAKHKGDLEQAKALYLESTKNFCSSIDWMNLAEIYIALKDTKSACEILIEATKNDKHQALIVYTENVLKLYSTSKALKAFYKANKDEYHEFDLKLKALEDEMIKSHQDKKPSDIALLPLDEAIDIFEIKLSRKQEEPLSLIYLACLYFKQDKKEKAEKLIKKIGLNEVREVYDVLISLIKNEGSFVCFIIPFLPKNNPQIDRLAMIAYFLNQEYSKVLEPSLQLMKEYPDNPEPVFFRTQSFYRLENDGAALFLIELIEEKGWMNDIIMAIKAEIEKKRLEKPLLKNEKLEKRESVKKIIPVQNGFVPEKIEPSEAKLSRLQKKEVLRNKGDSGALHIGSKSIKNGVDPIEHKTRFNPLDFKPREDEPKKTAETTPAPNPLPKLAIAPLFLTRLAPDQIAQVEYAISCLSDLIAFKKKEIDPPFKNALLFRNHIYASVRVYGILSELANPPIKHKLYNLRNEARHEFMVCSLESCDRLLNYLQQVNLIAQMKEWIQGGIITNLAVSPYSLRDPLENRKFEQKSPLEKNLARISFIKNELDLLIQLMEPIKTLEDFKKEGIYQNAMKASMMMLGKTWSQLQPEFKARLAAHFRFLNLEGNKGAHQLKAQTIHHEIIFNLGFDDISIESLWDFAQNANTLRNFLVGII